jgi:hypothetical protein
MTIAVRNERNTKKYKLKKRFLMKWINGRLPEKTSYDKHNLLFKKIIGSVLVLESLTKLNYPKVQDILLKTLAWDNQY